MKSKKTLRELMEKGPVFAPCVYDCVSAKIVEACGFEAMCLSGGEVAASLCGVPDIGLMGFDEILSVADHITSISPLPMIVDIDTGFGNELNVMRTCERIAKAGAMAVHMEDQTFPKRCGHLVGKEVIPREDYISKIKAAHHVLKDTDCLLIARTDSFNVLGKEEAIARNILSLEAGADVAFTEATDSVEAIEEIGRRVPGWKMFGMASGGASPKVTYDQLVSWGYNLITFHCTMGGAMKGMVEFAQQSYAGKSDIYATEHKAQLPNNIPGMFELMGLHEWLDLAASFNSNIKPAAHYKPKA